MLDPVYYAVSAVMWAWHQLFALLLGPASGAAWALSVVFLVLTLRAVMIRPFLAQMRSAATMRALAPQLAELRTRHRDDREALLRETAALRSAHGVPTLAGCLPALIQLPVFLGLLHVLHSFNRPGLTFEQNAAIANYVFPPGDVRSFLSARLFGAPLSSYVAMPQPLLDAFGGHVERWEVVAVALPLMVLAAVATHFTARHALEQNPMEGPGAAVQRLMPWVLPLGALLGGLFFPFPVAILLYWLTNNAWTLVQQRLVHRRLAAAPPVVPAPPPPPEPVVSRKPGAKPVRRHASGHRPSRKRRATAR